MQVLSNEAAVNSGNQIYPKSSGAGKLSSDLANFRRNNAGISCAEGGFCQSESFSSDSLKLTYSNSDGDSVVLDMQRIQYQKSISGYTPESAEQWGDITDFVKNEFESMRTEIIRKFVEWLNGKSSSDETQESDESSDIPGLPEYWNAENTSQRIVDFAISFAGSFEGEGADFVETIKAAIEKGFGQALDALGDLPGSVGKLVSNTHDLVMKKLDDWAAQNGFTVQQEPEAEVAAA